MLRLAPATRTAAEAGADALRERVNARLRQNSSQAQTDGGWMFVLAMSAAMLTIAAIVRALSKPGR